MNETAAIARATDIATGLCDGNAAHVLDLARVQWRTAGFDAVGIQWLDRHIESSRPNLSGDLLDEFVQLMGSFYGQCLLSTFGGRWSLSDGKMAIWMDPHGFTYPFEAVHRQVTKRNAPSVAALYSAAVAALETMAA